MTKHTYSADIKGEYINGVKNNDPSYQPNGPLIANVDESQCSNPEDLKQGIADAINKTWGGLAKVTEVTNIKKI